MSLPPSARLSQRTPKSCRQCSQRKMRCSKGIPCTSCVKRGLAAECHLERVVLTKDKRAPSTGQLLHRNPAASMSPFTASEPHPPRLAESYSGPAEVNDSHLRHPSLETFGVLENLAWGRQSDTPQSATSGRSMIYESNENCPDILPLQQEDAILAFHKDEIAWMHNVLHVPTFLTEWAERRQRAREKWVPLDALYLALMAVSSNPAVLVALFLTRQSRLVYTICLLLSMTELAFERDTNSAKSYTTKQSWSLTKLTSCLVNLVRYRQPLKR